MGRYSKPQPSILPGVDSTVTLPNGQTLSTSSFVPSIHEIVWVREAVSWSPCVSQICYGECTFSLSASKTIIYSRIAMIGWTWCLGTSSASPHRISTLATCSRPTKVVGTLNAVLPWLIQGVIKSHPWMFPHLGTSRRCCRRWRISREH